ncbi:MAG TPA: xanthine dehydrogenase family protein molybdopterin-binding subunit [Ramlibacter sp.]|nr:xanthine dehydrogenase family protein molybdopterin-binding subunit [Ramlibacter sp.]
MEQIKFGQSTTRREDDRLLTGRGEYTDDFQLPGALHIVFVRSPHASATLRSIDAAAALAYPGVVAVLSGADLVADGVPSYAAPFQLKQADGTLAVEAPRPWLVHERVRFLGEPVAMVLAESLQAALDASELVLADYDELPAVVDVLEAAQSDAPQLWPDRPGNRAFYWSRGDAQAVEAALAASAHVARLTSRISRVGAIPLEPRSAQAWIGEDGRPVLRASHQGPHLLRDELAGLFKLDRGALRVLAGDVGGSFGMKFGPQREEILTFWAALRLRRAVRWTATRAESFLCDEQARDVVVSTELGLDPQGRFTVLRVRYDVNVGAYLSWRSTTPIMNIGGIAGVYTTPVIAADIHGWFTNTQMTSAYRGAGRPDATYAIERIIDVAAMELGIDPVELRRRNLIPTQAMPYQTPFIFRYDCGEFERNLDKALALADYAGFAHRRAQARRDDRLRGIGVVLPIEIAGARTSDAVTVRANADGTVTLRSGSMSVGQGLDTVFSGLVAQALGLRLDQVRYEQGDTDLLKNGRGSGGSSALIISGTAITLGTDDLVARARQLAARELEAAVEDIAYAQGELRVIGTDSGIALAAVARRVEEGAHAGVAALEGNGEFAPDQATFPNGCHICEVEIDGATGEVVIVNYVSVEDFGRILNPLLVEGQVHGGVVQGIGQALMEQVHYDESGQLVTGSFMDYAMPRAADMPRIESVNLETPTALNPLGVKGVGEAGTVGGLAATNSAVCNALFHAAGIKHLDMPATPGRVWQALQDAGFRG